MEEETPNKKEETAPLDKFYQEMDEIQHKALKGGYIPFKQVDGEWIKTPVLNQIGGDIHKSLLKLPETSNLNRMKLIANLYPTVVSNAEEEVTANPDYDQVVEHHLVEGKTSFLNRLRGKKIFKLESRIVDRFKSKTKNMDYDPYFYEHIPHQTLPELTRELVDYVCRRNHDDAPTIIKLAVQKYKKLEEEGELSPVGGE